jgi:uncharacterized protein (TIGR03118 family)
MHTIAVLFAVTVVVLRAAVPAYAFVLNQQNLVTDDQAANPAVITDPELVNAWGVSRSPSCCPPPSPSPSTSPFWVSDNGTGKVTLYAVDPLTNAPAKQGLTVTIPNGGKVTGQAFNGNAAAFNGDRFLFVSEDGTISGWRPALGTAAEVLQAASPNNVYTGATLAQIGNDTTWFYAANFRAGTIDVLRSNNSVPLGTFRNRWVPAGFAPFNIQYLEGNLFVTYARQDATGLDDVPGPGNGYAAIFDFQGNLVAPFRTFGMLNSPFLNSPWGLALAPSSAGAIAGDLLVGNFGDGRINVFELHSFSFVGQVMRSDGTPLEIPGLWALIAGNDGSGGSSQDIYFSAGPNDESHGLFGVLSVPEPAGVGMLAPALLALVLIRRRRVQIPEQKHRVTVAVGCCRGSIPTGGSADRVHARP